MSVKVGVASLEAVLDTIVPVGSVIAFAGVSVPDGWLLCNGAAISRSVYTRLFTAIDIAHGYGDNSTTFNLPDYRGRFLRGVDGGAGNDPDAAGRTAANTGGATGNNVGSVQGSAFGSHRHSLRGTASGSGSLGNIGQTGVYGLFGSSQTLGQTYIDLVASSGASWVQNTGSNETRPKNVNVNYLIRI